MDYKALFAAANDVIHAIDAQPPQYASKNVLTSIKNQMLFIRDHAAVGNDPAKELPSGKAFNYGILSSREFASPEEMILKDLIDEVSRITGDE